MYLLRLSLTLRAHPSGPKASQIAASPPISLAWWLFPTKTQFRITADAFIFPPPSHPLHSKFPADRLAPSPNFNWEAERLRIWRKMSPDLRASFVRPIPGTKLEEDPEKWPTQLPTDLEAKTEEEKRLVKQGPPAYHCRTGLSLTFCYDPTALENFALIVLEPHSVDL